MRPKDRRVAMLIAVPGVLFCGWAVVAFFRSIVRNELPWADVSSAPEHYLAVGESYSRGFAAGFFLCFFLAIAALAVSAWAKAYRSMRLQSLTGAPTPARRQADREGPPPADAPRPASPVPATSRR